MVDIFELPSLSPFGSVDLPRGCVGVAQAFSPDSKYLAVGSRHYFTIIDVAKMKRVEGVEFGPFAGLVSDVDFSPVEPILAFTSMDKIHLLDTRTFQPICDPIERARDVLRHLFLTRRKIVCHLWRRERDSLANLPTE